MINTDEAQINTKNPSVSHQSPSAFICVKKNGLGFWDDREK